MTAGLIVLAAFLATNSTWWVLNITIPTLRYWRERGEGGRR